MLKQFDQKLVCINSSPLLLKSIRLIFNEHNFQLNARYIRGIRIIQSRNRHSLNLSLGLTYVFDTVSGFAYTNVIA